MPQVIRSCFTEQFKSDKIFIPKLCIKHLQHFKDHKGDRPQLLTVVRQSSRTGMGGGSCISDRSQVVLKLLGSCWHFESHWTTEQFKKAVKDSRKALWSYCSQAVPEASTDSG